MLVNGVHRYQCNLIIFDALTPVAETDAAALLTSASDSAVLLTEDTAESLVADTDEESDFTSAAEDAADELPSASGQHHRN